MSLKRSSGSGTRTLGGSDGGAKVGRQELYDELKKLAASGAGFTPVDVALSIGAGEPQVSRALLGLAGATIAPGTLSLIRHMFLDPQQRTMAIGV